MFKCIDFNQRRAVRQKKAICTILLFCVRSIKKKKTEETDPLLKKGEKESKTKDEEVRRTKEERGHQKGDKKIRYTLNYILG